MTTTGTISPTEPGYYAGHTTEALEAVAADASASGLHIAAAYGADHPMAQEHLRIYVAATAALLAREATR